MTCLECRHTLAPCPTCGDLVCACRGAAIYLRRHYEPDGTPRYYRRFPQPPQRQGQGESLRWEEEA